MLDFTETVVLLVLGCILHISVKFGANSPSQTVAKMLSSTVARVSAIYIYTNLRFGCHKISYFKHHKLQFETASEQAITDKV